MKYRKHTDTQQLTFSQRIAGSAQRMAFSSLKQTEIWDFYPDIPIFATLANEAEASEC